METIDSDAVRRAPWNKGKLVGQKAPLKLKEIWAIRVRLQHAAKHRELAMFNLAIDSKLRDAHHETNEGNPDLSPHQKLASCAALAWTYEAGKHGSVPRH
jgi:hypothetical protein